ncbi:MAG: hypothetical protein LBO77_08520 [Desulfovibrio sp.]|jgi:hypothetical protein|nr:hypothetical protein [Desulfovibrio sp.]
MKALGLILKVLLWILLLAIALSLLLALSWWMRWPLFTGFFLLLGILGAVILFLVFRTLIRWRNKRLFVRKTLEGNSLPPAIVLSGDTLGTQWNALLKRDKGGGISSGEFFSRSWYVVLDFTGGLSPVFQRAAGSVAAGDKAYLARHDFASTTLLQIAETALSDQDREELLVLLARDVRKNALRGVILLLSATEIGVLNREELREQGFLHRSRLYDLMVVVNRNLPLYILVQDLDKLPGAADLLSRPTEKSGLLPGCFFADESGEEASDSAGRDAARAADALLRKTLYDDLVLGLPPRGDELLFLETLSVAGGRLDDFLSALLQDMAPYDSFRLRGIFFCGTDGEGLAGRQQGGMSLGAALGGVARFCARSLPAARASQYPLRGRFTAYFSLKLFGFAAWLLALLCVCGLFAANTLYQTRILTSTPPELAWAPPVKEMEDLLRQMAFIQHLERARARWILPSFGLDMLARVERKEKNDFISRMHREVIVPSFRRLRDIFWQKDSSDVHMHFAAIAQLLWFCNAVADNLSLGRQDSRITFIPLPGDENWVTIVGDLVSNGLSWSVGKDYLELLASELRTIILAANSNSADNIFLSAPGYYNIIDPDRKICLSQFWLHIQEGSAGDVCVATNYTSTVFDLLNDDLHNFQIIAENDSMIMLEMQKIRNMYLAAYAEQWQKFVEHFCAAAVSVDDSEVYAPYAGGPAVAKTPHIMLLRVLSRELKPLALVVPPPIWLKDAQLADAMLTTLIRESSGKVAKDWKDFVHLGATVPDSLKNLWNVSADSGNALEIYEGLHDLSRYYNAVENIFQSIAEPGKSLALARTHFAGNNAEAVKASPYTAAEAALLDSFRLFSTGEACPQLAVLSNLLKFAGNGIVIEAARSLQKDWENKVLASPVALYGKSGGSSLFGKDGVVTTFAETELFPFLQRHASGVIAAKWLNSSFPFTLDFLNFLTNGEISAVAPAPSAEQTILLRSQPTLTNADALEKPDTTTLTLLCRDKTYRLVNRNYPHNERFTYRKGECSKADLTVSFPSFALRREYPDFPSFLEEFQYGERIFLPADAPEAAENMAARKVQFIRVRLLPDNVAGILRERADGLLTAPERITYTR